MVLNTQHDGDNAPDAPPLLEARSVSKFFPGVVALSNADMTLAKGEVLAVIGENGAGKSTLMKVLAGIQQPDGGEVLIDGQRASLNSVQDAMAAGVALIHQELNLADNLDVASNIFLGREHQRLGFIDKKRIEREAAQAMQRVGLNIPPNTPVSALSTGRRQMVEIAKAISAKARILIMDEPTSSLSEQETQRLYEVVEGLSKSGVGIIFISHRLAEVKRLADRVTVLRDGENAGGLAKNEIEHDAMVRLMVGREASSFYKHTVRPVGETVLDVEDLVTHDFPEHRLSFKVGGGEVVGVAGLVGAGRTEMLRTLFGIDRPLGGSVSVDGTAHTIHSPIQAIRAGLALVPEDRKDQGVFLTMSIRENTSLPRLKRDAYGGVIIDRAGEKRLAEEMSQRLATKASSIDQLVGNLSGGNQQKVVIAKWMAMGPRVLLLDEPTRGVDIGARAEIYKLMEDLAKQGVAVLFVSSDLEEVLGVADRVLVMHEGKITGELNRDQLNAEAVMGLATNTHASPDETQHNPDAARPVGEGA